MLKNFIAGFLLFIATFLSTYVYAFDNGEDQKVEARLISEVQTVQAGQSFYVAIQQIITPNWHTYWKNPGDSGLATTIEWQLPDNTEVSDIYWPTPQPYQVGSLTNYGYSDEVLLLTKITPPETLSAGSVLDIQAKVNWLACEEICIPESATLSLSLPVTDQPIFKSRHAKKFDETRKKLPKENTAEAEIDLTNDQMTLVIRPVSTLIDQETIQNAYFFNDDGITVAHEGKQDFNIDNDELRITLKNGDVTLKHEQYLTGDLALTTQKGRQSFKIKAQGQAPKTITSSNQAKSGFIQIATAAFFAFLGGLALNLMPCVFPVLSMKALSLVKHAHSEDKKHVRMGGIFYLIGVLTTFTALAIFIITLRAAGEKVGWGAQLQSPTFVLVTAYVLFIIGYALTGAVSFGNSFMGIGSKWTQRHGLAGSFFTGVLAVVVATPCTAPLMGAAIFFAFTQPWYISLLVIQMLGLGLALPYVILTFSPRLLSLFPKPGIWMESFKQFLAFPMFGATIWLVWVLSQQAGSTGVLLSLSGIGFIAFGLWIYGTLSHDRHKGAWHIFKIVIALIFILIALSFTQTIRMAEPYESQITHSDQKNWDVFSPENLAQARAENKPVFVNMTAAWCITCLANERIALSSDNVKNLFKEKDITYLKGDWTNHDPVITSYIKSFGRSGVPLYVYYPPAGEGVVLPQLLTPDLLISKIKKATFK